MSYAELRSQFAHDLIFKKYDNYVSGQKRQLMTHVPVYSAMMQAKQLKLPQPAERSSLLKKEISRGPLDGNAPALLPAGARDGLLKTDLPSDAPAPPIEPLKHTRQKLHKEAEQVAIKEELKSFPDKVVDAKLTAEYLDATTPLDASGTIVPVTGDKANEIAIDMAMKGVSERTKKYHSRLLKERERVAVEIKKAGGATVAPPELLAQWRSLNDALRPMADTEAYNNEVKEVIKAYQKLGDAELARWAAEMKAAAAAAPPATLLNPDKEHEVAAAAAAAGAAVDHPDEKHVDPPEVDEAKAAAERADVMSAIPADKRDLIPSHIMKPVHVDGSGQEREVKDGDAITMFIVPNENVAELKHLQEQYSGTSWVGKSNRLLSVTMTDGLRTMIFVGENVADLMANLRTHYKSLNKNQQEVIKDYFGWGKSSKDKPHEEDMTVGKYFSDAKVAGPWTLATIPPFRKMWSPSKTGREGTTEFLKHILPRGHVKSFAEVVAADTGDVGSPKLSAAASPQGAFGGASVAASSPAVKSKAVTAPGVVPNTGDKQVQQLMRMDNTGGGDADDDKQNA